MGGLQAVSALYHVLRNYPSLYMSHLSVCKHFYTYIFDASYLPRDIILNRVRVMGWER